MSSPFLRSFLAHAGRRVVASAALALVEAASLLLLVPLVELLGLGQVRAAASLGNVWRNVFASLGIPANSSWCWLPSSGCSWCRPGCAASPIS